MDKELALSLVMELNYRTVLLELSLLVSKLESKNF